MPDEPDNYRWPALPGADAGLPDSQLGKLGVPIIYLLNSSVLYPTTKMSTANRSTCPADLSTGWHTRIVGMPLTGHAATAGGRLPFCRILPYPGLTGI